ncbi:hypothetical protein ES332_D11G280600v1 [Gossypium tomentosum]|uniref:Uncharacterized protein n=1 Tax=Gossypium tomentosum TaxID=34277 RepID=A0A5D2IUS7_GOSTO|nr:hypothetical protein ES332_D11G280600v1 [Gossypium tomentosum]
MVRPCSFYLTIQIFLKATRKLQNYQDRFSSASLNKRKQFFFFTMLAVFFGCIFILFIG